MAYRPSSVPGIVENLPQFLQQELFLIEEGFLNPGEVSILQFSVWNVEPDKPRDGMTVLADGTNWNPGAGEGVYTYYNATWNKLG